MAKIQYLERFVFPRVRDLCEQSGTDCGVEIDADTLPHTAVGRIFTHSSLRILPSFRSPLQPLFVSIMMSLHNHPITESSKNHPQNGDGHPALSGEIEKQDTLYHAASEGCVCVGKVLKHHPHRVARSLYMSVRL